MTRVANDRIVKNARQNRADRVGTCGSNSAETWLAAALAGSNQGANRAQNGSDGARGTTATTWFAILFDDAFVKRAAILIAREQLSAR
jgi:hypothetical protein